MSATLAARAASAILWLNGLGFGIPCVVAIRALVAGRDIPFIMGFPAYGRGPFEAAGLKTTIPLLIAFLIVCALEVAAGGLLWAGVRWGAILAIALLPLGAVFWWGFDLPIPWLFAVLRTVLIVVGWRGLS